MNPIELLLKQIGFDPVAMKENFASFMNGVNSYIKKDEERMARLENKLDKLLAQAENGGGESQNPSLGENGHDASRNALASPSS